MLPPDVRDLNWLKHETEHLEQLSITYPDIKIDIDSNTRVHYYSRLIHSDPKVILQSPNIDVIEAIGCTLYPQLQIDNCDTCNFYYNSPEFWIVSDMDIDIFKISDSGNGLSLFSYKEFMLDNGFLESAVKEIDLFVIKFIRDHENIKNLQIDNRIKKLLLFS